MGVADWSITASENETVAGIDIAPGCARANIDDAIRAMMAELKAKFLESASVKDYGALGDGVTDDTVAIQAAVDASTSAGMRLLWPAGVYKITSTISVRNADWIADVSGMGAYAPGIWWEGDGSGSTILKSYTSSGALIDIDSDVTHSQVLTCSTTNGSAVVTTANTSTLIAGMSVSGTGIPASTTILSVGTGTFTLSASATASGATTVTFTVFKALLGVNIEGMTLTDGGATGSSGINLRTTVNASIRHVNIFGFDQDGLKIQCDNGDLDGCVNVKLEHMRIESCGRWGIDATPASGNNEISFLELNHVFLQGNGTSEAVTRTITAITKASPAVVTFSGGTLESGQRIKITSVAGMTQVNDRVYRVANVTATTAELQTIDQVNVDSSAYGTYTSAGTVTRLTNSVTPPTSGGMRWKGQFCRVISSGFTINQNVGLFLIGESAAQNGLQVENTAFENNYRRQLYIRQCQNVRLENYHLYNNDSYTAEFGLEVDGTDYAVNNIVALNGYVRATSGNNPYYAYRVTKLSTNYHRIAFIDKVVWDNFGYTGQVRFHGNGVEFDPVPYEAALDLAGATTTSVSLLATRRGCQIPYRRRYAAGGHSEDGEWQALQVRSSGITLSNSGLAISTTYNVYLYDNGNVPTLEASATATAADTVTSYLVKSGAAGYAFVGRVATNGSSQFLTGAAARWLNPAWNEAMGYYWRDSTGALRANTSLPANDTDGTAL